MEGEMAETVLTVGEVAQELRLGRNSVYEAIRTGEVPSIRIGRRILVPRRALERLLESADHLKSLSDDESVGTPGSIRSG
jgi:excisionase family DNA binding protein